MPNRPSQAERIYDILKDGNPHNVRELIKEVYGLDHLGYPNLHGRITDLRKKYGVKIINFKDDEIKSLTWYQLVPNDEIPLTEMPEYEKFQGQAKLV